MTGKNIEIEYRKIIFKAFVTCQINWAKYLRYTMFHDRFVVTAAHCIDNENTGAIEIRLGKIFSFAAIYPQSINFQENTT